ncbi:MAG: acyl carrier protein [Actinomycetota bacterium]|nr:acyl carrier protein [Actinomycetota bacterium]
MTDLEPRVRAVVAAHLDIEPGRLLPTARLGEDLCIDSLDAVDLTMVLEDEFDIALPDEIVEKVRTYGDVVDLVRERVDARAKAGST